jgi:hypothetical protein
VFDHPVAAPAPGRPTVTVYSNKSRTFTGKDGRPLTDLEMQNQVQLDLDEAKEKNGHPFEVRREVVRDFAGSSSGASTLTVRAGEPLGFRNVVVKPREPILVYNVQALERAGNLHPRPTRASSVPSWTRPWSASPCRSRRFTPTSTRRSGSASACSPSPSAGRTWTSRIATRGSKVMDSVYKMLDELGATYTLHPGSNLMSLVSRLHRRLRIAVTEHPSRAEDVQALQARAPFALPSDYLEFLADDPEVILRLDDGEYFRLWNAGGAVELNAAYDVRRFMPMRLRSAMTRMGRHFCTRRGPTVLEYTALRSAISARRRRVSWHLGWRRCSSRGWASTVCSRLHEHPPCNRPIVNVGGAQCQIPIRSQFASAPDAGSCASSRGSRPA